MKTSLLFLVLLLLTSTIAHDLVEEDDVAVVTEAKYDSLVQEHEHVLIEFYAPWCGHCKKLTPEYAKAAKELKAKGVVLGKVDATVETSLASKFNVKGYPTIKYIFKGEAIEYNGGRTSETIVSWMTKRLGEIVPVLETKEAYEKAKTDNQVVIIYFGNKEDKEYETLKLQAMSDDDISYYIVTDKTIGEEYKRQTLYLFKQFDEGVNTFEGEFTVENIKQFVSNNSFATVINFDDKAIAKIFQQQNPTVFLFCDEKVKACEDAEKQFAEAAKQMKGGKVLFSNSHPTDKSGHYNRLGEYVGADTTNVPSIVLMNPSTDVSKYKFTQEITKENIMKFVEDFNNNKLTKFLKSQEAQPNDGNVVVIVGNNFDELVVKNNKDVLVEFYAPWCGHCKQLAPIYSELADKLASNPNIVIAKVDSTANEIPSVQVSSYPTLLFFPSNKKQTPVDYKAGRDLDGFLKWLKENTTHEWVEIEETKDQKKEEVKEQDL